MALGPRLAEMGRFPETRPYLQLRMPALQHWYAAPQALISPEVVPFRPHRGVVVIVEEPVGADTDAWLHWLHTDHFPAVLATPGVAGAWMYGTTSTWNLHPSTLGDPQYTTVIYLDDDPLATTNAAASPSRGTMGNGSGAPAVRRPAPDDDPVGSLALRGSTLFDRRYIFRWYKHSATPLLPERDHEQSGRCAHRHSAVRATTTAEDAEVGGHARASPGGRHRVVHRTRVRRGVDA